MAASGGSPRSMDPTIMQPAPTPGGRRRLINEGQTLICSDERSDWPSSAFPWPATFAAGASVSSPSDIAIGLRLLQVTATTTTSAATTAIVIRSGVLVLVPVLHSTTAGAISSATRFITLITGMISGPAASLNRSPTVSPAAVSAFEDEPLP